MYMSDSKCLSNDRYEKLYDDYSIIMVKALADRLAEVIMCIIYRRQATK